MTSKILSVFSSDYSTSPNPVGFSFLLFGIFQDNQFIINKMNFYGNYLVEWDKICNFAVNYK